MADVNSSDAAGGYRYSEDSTINRPVIDQQSYSYRAVVFIPQGCGTYLSVESIRVDFAYQTSLPLVTRGK